MYAKYGVIFYLSLLLFLFLFRFDILGMASAYEGLGDKYFNGSDGFTKDFELAVRWYRKAEKKIKTLETSGTGSNFIFLRLFLKVT